MGVGRGWIGQAGGALGWMVVLALPCAGQFPAPDALRGTSVLGMGSDPSGLPREFPTLAVARITPDQEVLARIQQLEAEAVGIRLEFRLELGNELHTIPLDGSGTAQAVAALEKVFPGQAADGTPAYQATGTWQLLGAMARPEFRQEFLRVASLSNGKVFRITVLVDDTRETILPGTKLWVPEFTMGWGLTSGHKLHTIQEGETLEDVAWSHGLEEDQLFEWNKYRLHAWPAAHYGQDGIRDVRFGESRLAKDDTARAFLPTLLHEVGHVADTSRCALEYGPDGKHHLDEVVNPGAAFIEGWANYVGAHAPGWIQDYVATPRRLRLETSKAAYVELDDRDLTALDYLSNETFVAGVLLDLEQLPGGRTSIERAFRLTNGEPCRSLATFLEAYLRMHPDQASAVVRTLAGRSHGHVGSLDLDIMRQGRLPADHDPKLLPRSREYTPSTGPTRIDQLQDFLRGTPRAGAGVEGAAVVGS